MIKKSAAAAKRRDKIFNNSFDSAEMNTAPISFSRDSVMVEERTDEKVDREMIEAKMRDALTRCDWAVEMMTRDNAAKTVNKQEFNSLFKFLFEEAGGHSVEVFAFIETEMDLDPSKLYDLLSNSIKTELHAELRRRGYLRDDGGMPLP